VLLEKSSLDLNLALGISAITIVAIQMASLRFRIHLKPVLDSWDFEDPSK